MREAEVQTTAEKANAATMTNHFINKKVRVHDEDDYFARYRAIAGKFTNFSFSFYMANNKNGKMNQYTCKPRGSGKIPRPQRGRKTGEDISWG